MARWIDADKLKEALKQNLPQYMWGEMFVTVNIQPSIDIVRCCECKYKRINEDDETRYYYCALEVRPNRQWSVDDMDYCSWGEVRDEQMDK